MNRMLTESLAFVNALIAIILIVACAWWGARVITFGGPGVGFVIGGVLGFGMAGLVCGTIATIVLIEGHLRKLAERRDPPRHSNAQRHEPSI